MNERERRQTDLIVKHESGLAHRKIEQRLNTIFADHSAKGRLHSGMTIIVSIQAMGEEANVLLDGLSLKVQPVATGQDAFDVIANAVRSLLQSCRDDQLPKVMQAVNGTAGDSTRGPGDPLFPATAIALDASGGFAPVGLARHGWSTSEPVREVFRRAFALAGLPYFNPHSFRDMLVRYAMTLDLSPEAMKAWSQNLGHNDVMTTFTSYGSVPGHRQGDLIRSSGRAQSDLACFDDDTLMATLKARLGKAA